VVDDAIDSSEKDRNIVNAENGHFQQFLACCFHEIQLLACNITVGCFRNHPFSGKQRNFDQMKEICIL